MRILMVSFFVFFYLACEKDKPDPLIDFEINKNNWESFNINSYTYNFQVSCYCPDEITSPKEVEVIDGEIVIVNNTTFNVELHWGVLSISQLFYVIEEAQKNKAAVIKAEYHEEKGYPVTVYIDQEEMIADEEMGYFVSDLNY